MHHSYSQMGQAEPFHHAGGATIVDRRAMVLKGMPEPSVPDSRIVPLPTVRSN
jgi:hypothetical protein